MEIQHIPQADLLDLLFEGRNKDYGAYELRKTYNKRLRKALLLTGSICLVMIGSYILADRLDKRPVQLLETGGPIILAEAPIKEKTIEPVIPPKLKALPPAQTVTIRDVTPRITPDNQVRPEDQSPVNTELDKVKIGTANTAGSTGEDVVGSPAGDGAGTGVTAAPEKKDPDDGIYIDVGIEASYESGIPGWQRFLQKNFHCPEQAIADNISGTVIVEFVVDKEGNVSDVRAISGPEILRQEAVRVIKKSGKWNPGIQNGRKVNSYKRQPIVVELQNE